MVTHIGMKLSIHTYYVTPITHKWFPWQPPTTKLRHPHDIQMVSMATTNNKQPQVKPLLYFSNLPTMVHVEMKLGVHVHFIVSMTTVNKKCPQALFPITTSSLFKLAHHTMRGGETHVYLIAKNLLLLHFSNLHTMQCMEVKLGTHVYVVRVRL